MLNTVINRPGYMMPGIMKKPVLRTITVLFGAVLLSASALMPTPATKTRTVWDNVFTSDQASRGLQIFSDHCALCHAASMLGGPGTPALIGPEFRFLWADKSVGALFEIIRAKMPPGQAGSLSDQEYADVLAAIFQNNGFPAGEDTELSSDSTLTSDILITWDRP